MFGFGCKKTPVMESMPNVLIFNNIKNNQKDVANLHKTFSSIGCRVGEVIDDKYEEVVKHLEKEKFNNFKFIVIAVLDDTNDDERYFKTSDGKQIELYTDVLEAVYRNPSLHKKLCFFLLQINRNYSNFKQKPRSAETKVLSHDYVMYFATSSGCCLDKHAWDSEGASPFISILCEEIQKNSLLQRPIVEMLDAVTDRMKYEANEYPSMLKNIDADSYCIP